ncbi:MAG: biopolymer transporter ExbD [Cytophagales bacterium]|nr:biopolymer transporter ExbD [Cytophagales bacterium]
MFRKRVRVSHPLNAGTMADIAFLLLIFFLVTATIDADRGLTLLLPPKIASDEPPVQVEKSQRNILKVVINEKDQLFVGEEQIEAISQLKASVKEFVLNNGKNPHLSDSPKEALVTLKTDKNTRYALYIAVLDQIQGAYYEMYGERVGLTAEAFRKLDRRNPHTRKRYEAARKDFPMNIAIIEPTNTEANEAR